MPKDLQKWRAHLKELEGKENLDEAEKREVADLKKKIVEAEADEDEDGDGGSRRATTSVELRMPRDVREAVRDRAEEQHISTHSYIMQAVEEALAGRRASAEGLAELQQLCALHKQLSDAGQTQAAANLEKIIRAKSEDLCDTHGVDPAPASNSRTGSKSGKSKQGEPEPAKKDSFGFGVLDNLIRR